MRNVQQVQVFDSQYAWNSQITDYIKSGMPNHALALYQQLPKDNSVYLSGHTYVTLLKACTKLKDIRQGFVLHADVAGRGLVEKDIFIGNTLIDMYAKLGLLGNAQQVFEKLSSRDVISWTAFIGGCTENGRSETALQCFELMKLDGVPPNAATFICSLKACGKIGALDKGQAMHKELERHGVLDEDLFVCSAIIHMYVKCGSLGIALQVFDKFPVRDVVAWTTLIAGYLEHEYAEVALDCYQHMQLEGVSPNSATFVCILKSCGSIGSKDKGKEIHTQVKTEGLLGDLLVVNALIDMYAKFGSLASAQEVFDTVRVHDVVSWTALIAGYIEDGQIAKALICFEQMEGEDVSPNAITFVCCLKACECVADVKIGWKLHTDIERRGLLNEDIVVGNTLVDMYAKCSQLLSAQEMFNRLPVRNLVSWNALITAYAEHGCGEEALECLEQMRCEGVFSDSITYVFSLKASGSLGASSKGNSLHAEIDNLGLLKREPAVSNTLIEMYCKCGLLARARQVFDNLPAKNTVSWNILMTGYVEHGHGHEALQCFQQMQLEDVLPSTITFVCSLKACANIGHTEWGREIHSKIQRHGLFEGDMVVGNSLVSMYSKCGFLSRAQQLFDKLPFQGVKAWNALISGYVEQGYGAQALKFFEQMQVQGVWPNLATFVCILKACSSTRDAEKGHEIHTEIERYGVSRKNTQIEKQGLSGRDMYIGSALVDLYAKTGSLRKAQEVFNTFAFRNVVTWSTLLEAYTKHGHGDVALECFESLQLEGICPDFVIFACCLNACGDIGAVDKGIEIHGDIEKQGLLSNNLVGNSLVNMYAKCGCLAEARRVFDRLLVRDIVAWTMLMAGYANLGEMGNVLILFNKMVREGTRPDPISLAVVLKACSMVGLFNRSLAFLEMMTQHHGVVFVVDYYSCIMNFLSHEGQIDELMCIVKKLSICHDRGFWQTLLGFCRNFGSLKMGELAFKHAVCA